MVLEGSSCALIMYIVVADKKTHSVMRRHSRAIKNTQKRMRSISRTRKYRRADKSNSREVVVIVFMLNYVARLVPGAEILGWCRWLMRRGMRWLMRRGDAPVQVWILKPRKTPWNN